MRLSLCVRVRERARFIIMTSTAGWVKILHNLYYDVNQASALSGVNALYKAARAKIPNITIGFVRNWFNRQRAPTLWRQAPKRFKKNPIVQTRPMWQVQSDLMDLNQFTSFNGGHRYVLVVIDVFTKRAFCRALKNKSAAVAGAAIRSVLDPLDTVKVFQSDLGLEFFNATVKAYFRERKIEVWLSQDRETKAQCAERFIQTLRSKIMRFMTAHDTKNWVDVLPNLVANYNSSRHRSIGMSPNDATPDRYHEIRRRLYPPAPKTSPPAADGVEAKRDGPTARQRRQGRRVRREDDLKVGDLVRISRLQETFEKLTFRWTDELWRIRKVIKRTPRVIFQLVDLHGEDVLGHFYREHLLKVPEGEIH